MNSSTMQKSGSKSGVQLVASSMAVCRAREMRYSDIGPHWYWGMRQVEAGQAPGAIAGAREGPATGGRAALEVSGKG